MLEQKENYNNVEIGGSYQTSQVNTEKEPIIKTKVIEQKQTTNIGNYSIQPNQSFGMMNEIINNNIHFIDKCKLSQINYIKLSK